MISKHFFQQSLSCRELTHSTVTDTNWLLVHVVVYGRVGCCSELRPVVWQMMSCLKCSFAVGREAGVNMELSLLLGTSQM